VGRPRGFFGHAVFGKKAEKLVVAGGNFGEISGAFVFGQSVVDFSQIDGAEMEWLAVILLNMTRAVHQALVVNAVIQSEHVPYFMDHNL